MIQKCANPECGSEFRYSNRGRLFPFEIRHPKAPCRDVPSAICSMKPSHATILFWLCENCAPRFTVRFTPETGLSIAAFPRSQGSQSKKSSDQELVQRPFA